MPVEYLKVPGRRRLVAVEFEHLDDGRYGWKAEAVALVGVREYAESKDAARQAIVSHISQEYQLRVRITKPFEESPLSRAPLWLNHVETTARGTWPRRHKQDQGDE